MISSSQIRNQMSLYLAGIVPLDEFEDWFVQNTWNIHKTGSKAAEVLTFAIEEALSEFSSGHISQDQLRDELSTIIHADNRNVEIADVPQVAWSLKSCSAVAYLPVLAQP